MTGQSQCSSARRPHSLGSGSTLASASQAFFTLTFSTLGFVTCAKFPMAFRSGEATCCGDSFPAFRGQRRHRALLVIIAPNHQSALVVTSRGSLPWAPIPLSYTHSPGSELPSLSWPSLGIVPLFIDIGHWHRQKHGGGPARPPCLQTTWGSDASRSRPLLPESVPSFANTT